MANEKITFSEFLESIECEHLEFINRLHGYLLENSCVIKIRQASSGYVVSYFHKPSSRTVMNYLFRKKMLMLRAYTDNINLYIETVSKWPNSMKETIKNGGDCSRLSNPTKCNSRCLKGFDFMLDGERQQKCRCHNALTFALSKESKPYLFEIMKLEMEARI